MSDETRALDLAAIRARSDQYRQMHATAGLDALALAASKSGDDVPALLTEVERLRAQVATAEAPLDASVYAERIAGLLRKKVWQHAKPETVAHARQVLEPEVRNLIFQVARAMVPTAKAVFGEDGPAHTPSGGDTIPDEGIEAADRAIRVAEGMPLGDVYATGERMHPARVQIVRTRATAAATAAWEVFTARHAAEIGRLHAVIKAHQRAEMGFVLEGREQAAQAIETFAESIGWYEDGGVWAEALELARGQHPMQTAARGATPTEEVQA